MVSRAGKGSPSTMALSCSQAKAWVNSNYEIHEDGVVAKSVMYKHYEDYCRDQGRNIMETSIFGRVVKSVFRDVKIRRLGGRDNLKYYYCGIRAQESSPYAIDNSTTTRPKRRLRKRELVTDKTEVHNCLRWLHANYTDSSDGSVIKTEVYDAYLTHCAPRGVEPLSAQYFGMVVTYAFPNVTKRKLGPRTNQQKYYFGMQERADPMNLELVSRDTLTNVEDVLKNGNKISYRDVYNENVDEEDEDEYTCRSPGSDMSDILSQRLHPLNGYDSEIGVSPRLQQYPFASMLLKEEPEPVDYSLSSLRLKDEPPEDEDLMIKAEPLDLQTTRDEERRTPEGPPSTGVFSNSISPPKEGNQRRIYKPRFHFHESPWNGDSVEDKRDQNGAYLFEESISASSLKSWILGILEPAKGVHVNRDQLYEYYEKYCQKLSMPILPMTFFDETMLKVFSGVVTMIHPSRKTFYEGIRIKNNSQLFNRVEELYQEEPQWGEEENSQNAMELSLADDSPSHSSSLNLEEEDEPPDEGFPFPCANEEEELHSSPEVLRDGKYYLRKWLMDNFESVPDSCVLKADAYRHYDVFARSINQTPFEMNVFGKIVRQVFPKVSIRRLGGRVKPQYHYCGIAVKATSPLHQFLSGKDPAQRSRKKEIATDNHSAEIVIDFLRRNYESGKERAIMKSEVFDNYTAFCNSINENPVTLNYFGKLVKHCFPNVEVRKFGGRSEPTWYYFGLFPIGNSTYISCPNSCSQISVSPSYPQEDSTIGEIRSSYGDLNNSSRFSPNFAATNLESKSQRHSTSPIPISLSRSSIISHNYSGSPSAFLANHIQHASRNFTYDDNNQGRSPADSLAPYYRESTSAHSPADLFYSRSPVLEAHSQGQLYHSQNMESMYNNSKELHQNPGIIPHLGGGQVVPSQTPPTLVIAHAPDYSLGLHVSHPKKAKKSFAVNQEEYEIYNEIRME